MNDITKIDMSTGPDFTVVISLSHNGETMTQKLINNGKTIEEIVEEIIANQDDFLRFSYAPVKKQGPEA